MDREVTARFDKKSHYLVCHVIVSPPPGLWAQFSTVRGFRRLRAVAYRHFKKAGGEGGTFIYHPLRCADKDDPVTTFGPHFHVLGFGWFKPWNATGWNVKNDRVARSVYATALYALSHSGRYLRGGGSLPKGNSRFQTEAVTHVGKVTIGPIEAPEGRFCPSCERFVATSEWMDVDWAGQGPPPTEPGVWDGSAWRVVTHDRTGGWGSGDVAYWSINGENVE